MAKRMKTETSYGKLHHGAYIHIDELRTFIDAMQQTGATHIIIHQGYGMAKFSRERFIEAIRPLSEDEIKAKKIAELKRQIAELESE